MEHYWQTLFITPTYDIGYCFAADAHEGRKPKFSYEEWLRRRGEWPEGDDGVDGFVKAYARYMDGRNGFRQEDEA